MDINRVLQKAVANDEITISLANYQHYKLSPLRSEDLLKAAEMPELNPFYPYFQRRLSGLVEKEQPATIGFSLTYKAGIMHLCHDQFSGLEYPRDNPGLRRRSRHFMDTATGLA